MLKTVSLLLTLAVAAGCWKNDSPPPSASDPAPSGAPAPAAATGAASLTPKPRDYTDKAWQASVTDDQIAKTILMGGAAVGKSPVMPAQPQLKEKPEVVNELVKIIRGFAK